jgi:7-cyano-7-deazaguanine synthase
VKEKYVVLLSGGLDSSVLAYHLKSEGNELRALTILYGQKHSKEKESATKLAKDLSIPHTVLELDALKSILGDACTLLNQNLDVPEGHYTDESMQSTVVPNRNMLLLSLATSLSVATNMNGVAYAAHAGDHTIYPDCRPEFADAMATAISLADFSSQKLIRPFIKMNKGDIVKLGTKLGVPFEITWSCYKGLANHCGMCGTCVERKEAFTIAQVPDPTTYEKQ